MDAGGQIKNSKAITVTNEYEDKEPRYNEEFYLQENNYPLGVLASDNNLYVAFSYDRKKNERARYALLKLDYAGTFLDSADFNMSDFYGRIFKVHESAGGDLIVSRGGRDWLAYDVFNSSVQRIETKRLKEGTSEGNLPSRFGDPILNDILDVNAGHAVFSGHIDLINNPNVNFVSNFDLLIVDYQFGGATAYSYGLPEYKELAFSSFAGADGTINLIGTRRGLNELIQDVESDLVLVTWDPLSKEFHERVIVSDQGMEGIAATQNSDGSISIVGVKTGFMDNMKQSFWMQFTP
jgi:hypothetical protein